MDGERDAFFHKDIGEGAPEWVDTGRIDHKERANDYPLVNDEATLVWLAQLASLEIHVPQWRFGPDGKPRNPDRLVLDLDPGPGVDLKQCAQVALMVKEILLDMGLDPVPVTSGSKGIHVYAALDGQQTSAQASKVARELARALEADHPGDITSTMKRSVRDGKVFIDWSQNNANKTTIAPYSLRGRARPTVAAPRTWREIASPRLRHVEYDEVLTRVRKSGDPMAALARATSASALDLYRSKRDAALTPEPVPAAGLGPASGEAEPVFVIQRHEARRLHHDFRLEHEGVLVSWALPKGVPTNPARNHLAVPTEDHPMEYRFFEGTIPKGQYGAGDVTIWDSGTYELGKWRDDEVIVTLHGAPGGGLGEARRFALFRTSEEPPQWMIHLMDDAPVKAGSKAKGGIKRRAAGKTKPDATARQDTSVALASAKDVPSPMLAQLATEPQMLRLDPREWAFEMKWDGMRVIAAVDSGQMRLVSRSGADVSGWFPELEGLASHLDVDAAVLDGEVVALGRHGAPSFEKLQQRMGLTSARDIAAARRAAEVSLLVFDVLAVNGKDCRRLPYEARRDLLQDILTEAGEEGRGLIAVPPNLDGDARQAMEVSRENRLEGIVAKRRSSVYKAGVRSADWLKFPFADAAEVVVIGWRESDSDAAGFASLLVAVPGEDGLVYAGRVSSGFTAADRKRLRATFKKIASSTPAADVPAADNRDAHWVRPELVGEVSFRERTESGRLRHSAWRGLRTDKKPGDLTA